MTVKFNTYKLSLEAFKTLSLFKEAVSYRDVSDSLRIDPARVSPIAMRLRRRKLIEEVGKRKGDYNNYKVQLWKITPEGLKALEENKGAELHTKAHGNMHTDIGWVPGPFDAGWAPRPIEEFFIGASIDV